MKHSETQLLAAGLGGDWTLQPLGRGGWCATARARRIGAARADGGCFVKSAPAARADMLQAEADGLAALAATGTLRVPAVHGCWTDAVLDRAVLAMEWLELSAAGGAASGERFGERFGAGLAALHAAPVDTGGGGRYGWRRDNWLGGTPQRNRWSDAAGLPGWLAFFGEERLGAIAARLAAAGAPVALVEAVRRVIGALPGFFDDGHVPRPALIHGDLWSGNWGALPDGTPVVYDPAVSVSDAEAELAMMELFGTPPPGFWDAYRDAAGLAQGYARRRGLYQLYHLLNHALLFGGGYARQSMALMDRLLARR